MILNKVRTCNTVEEIQQLVSRYSISQIRYEILSISGASLANKNKGANTPIFNMNLPIIRSIYGACLSILGKDNRPREQTKLNCEVVIGNGKKNGFQFYTKEDIYLAAVGLRICSQLEVIAI